MRTSDTGRVPEAWLRQLKRKKKKKSVLYSIHNISVVSVLLDDETLVDTINIFLSDAEVII